MRRIRATPPQREGSKEFREVSLGELYRGIRIPEREFEEGETRLVRKKDTRFVSYCKWAFKSSPSLGKGAKFKPQFEEAIAFLGWDLSAEQFAAGAKMAMILSVVAAASVLLLMIFSGTAELLAAATGPVFYLYLFLPLILLIYVTTIYVQNYPLNAARTEQLRALTYVPEIVGYLTMSMKLVPNLEKAVEFAADHGTGKIADEFKRIIWDVQLGVYNTLSEALDDLAYRWGKFSDEFKEALMMIRASVLEPSEAKRHQLLDKTMTDVLDAVKEKMEEYARSLSQPTIVLFYVAVLLPLTLIIILPVGSAFAKMPFAHRDVLIIIYNILIPAATILFVRNLLGKRPPTYEAAEIPDNYPFIPGKNRMKLAGATTDIRLVMALVLIAGVVTSTLLSTYGIVIPLGQGEEQKLEILAPDRSYSEVVRRAYYTPTYFDLEGVSGAAQNGELFERLYAVSLDSENAKKQVLLEKQGFLLKPENDITPYNLIFGLLITASLVLFVYLYYSNIYKRRVQVELMEMESEFKDSLYVIASRMGENRPLEEAMKHTQEFLPNYRVSTEVFGRTIDNINLLGMPLEAAVFDPTFGSLKYNPSKVIRSSMHLLIDSVKLGVNVAARTMIALSLQLSNSEKVSRMLSTLVVDITSMMKTMAIVIAPIVLGITTSLQRIVMTVLGGIAQQNILSSLGEGLEGGVDLSAAREYADIGAIESFTSGLSGLKGIVTPDSLQSLVAPWEFVVIVTVYVIELVVILTFFTTKIEEDNNVLAMVNIAKALPVAVIIFVVSVVVSTKIVGGMGF